MNLLNFEPFYFLFQEKFHIEPNKKTKKWFKLIHVFRDSKRFHFEPINKTVLKDIFF